MRSKGKGMPDQALSLRKVLVITQFAITIIVLGSTIIISQQLYFIQHKHVGYDRSYVIEINPGLYQDDWDAYSQKLGILEKEMRKIPELAGVARTSNSLVRIDNTNAGSLSWDGKDPAFSPIVNMLRADKHLGDVFELTLEKGRLFESDISTDSGNIILNETAIRQFDIPEPVLGRLIEWQGRKGQIIGILKDFHFKTFK